MSIVEDSDGHDGHHLPAEEDWPRGFGEASWWPFITAVGGAGFYVGVALWVLGMGEDALVGSIVGPATIAGSVLLLLVGMYGWLYHAFVADFWERGTATRSSSALRFGMLLFLGSEIATFGAGFVYYFFIRAGAWPPQELPHLLGSLVLINTTILIASSVTLHFAHVYLRRGNRKRFMQLLGVTLALGVVFIAGQAYEYYEFIIGEGFSITEGTFGSAFYGLTGLHGAHVTLGAILLGIIYARGLAGQYTEHRHTSVSTVSMYWHFVDAVWIFLVVALYVGAAA
ncbi:heme-copper oxidase subunit III [Halorhabdus sp. CBA1104]|uniref:cytochrome c oxidase subunit 3 n=1 Tax=unclassified Halorhabdus TaxID=2621901 RepID=UPI0012B26CF2|nr:MULTISPECIES: heme-copper oxidase subunit III [unclassified Halorhabdus]QGN06916.1 heme-copper oxidase subunit III [Halorhabdus sp. CBA1104]